MPTKHRIHPISPLVAARMKQAGIATVHILSHRSGVEPSVAGELVSLRRAPLYHDGDWTPAIVKIASVLRCAPEDLFTFEEIAGFQAKNARWRAHRQAELTFAAAWADARSTDPEQRLIAKERDAQIRKVAAELPKRKNRILVMRYWDEFTYEECGIVLGKEEGNDWPLSRERVRQIEMQSLRMLKHPKRQLRQLLDPQCYERVREVENAERAREDILAQQRIRAQADHKQRLLEWGASRDKLAQELREGEKRREAAALASYLAAEERAAAYRRETPPEATVAAYQDQHAAALFRARMVRQDTAVDERRRQPIPGSTDLVLEFSRRVKQGNVGSVTELRDCMAIQDKTSALVFFAAPLAFTFPDHRTVIVPVGYYIIPHCTVRNVPDNAASILQTYSA
jgi:RNA polymerase sigma factor (sigma-70 family)